MVDIDCDQCGSTFNKKPSLITDNNFCEQDCYSEWQSENRKGENHHQYDRVAVECETCGQEKEVKRSHHERVDNHYCGPECQAKNEDRSERQKEDKIEVECDYCGFQLKRYPYRVEQNEHNFCDRNCKGKFRTENRSGPNSPLFEHGGLNYGSTWPKMRKKIQERDNNVCQLCGDDEEDIGRKPDVHHIVPVKTFDDPNEAHQMDNMVQVCRSCHRKLEVMGEQEQRNRLYDDFK